MTIREQIIDVLSSGNNTDGYYDLFKHSIVCDGTTDAWFKGVIHSLYDKPNTNVLVLEGEPDYCERFINQLIPAEIPFGQFVTGLSNQKIYTKLIVNVEFFKHTLSYANEVNFRVIKENCDELIHPGTEFRLASYSTIVKKWHYTNRSNFLVHKLYNIDQEMFSKIDKLKLWQEIYQKFKPF